MPLPVLETVVMSAPITVESGTTREQIVHPDFWGHVAARLRPYAKIEVRCDDGSFYAELLVLAAERTFAMVRVLHWHDLTTADVAKTQAASVAVQRFEEHLKAYEVRWRGPHLMWSVIRKHDNAALREKEKTKQAAQTWLDEYLRVTATT